MTEEQRARIASFRFQVIAPLVTRELTRGEGARILRELAQKTWNIPGLHQGRIHSRTIERYVSFYRQGGFEALKPAVRRDTDRIRAVDQQIVENAVALRREIPSRSVEQIIQLLEWEGIAAPGVLKRSTLSHQLVKRGASRSAVAANQDTFRRRESPYRNREWQGDTQYVLRMPDPKNPAKTRQVYLIAFMDSYSRLVVSAKLFFEENRPRLEETLRQAILAYGIPETLYVDNGSVYHSDYLSRVCAELGVDLRHSRPYRPAGRGKIEKFFQYVDRSFTSEAHALIEAGRIDSLDKLNEYLVAWLKMGYNCRKHSSTKEIPEKRWANSEKAVRTLDPERLREIFLWQSERVVDKTGVFSLAGNAYEVDLSLARKRVVLRYDPYDLSRILVEYKGQRYPDAVPMVLRTTVHKAVPPRLEPPLPTGLSYLEAAKRKYEEFRRDEAGRISLYRGKEENE